nr:hypothetical protein [Tanacetum cinerariifolium]
MSDASSSVTYMSVDTDSEPWRYYREDSAEARSLGVIVYGYDGLPIQLVDPPCPDYVPGPEHLLSPDYVPGPEHPPSPIEIPYAMWQTPIRGGLEDDHAEYLADGRDGDDELSNDDDDDDDTDDEDEEPFEDEEDDEEEEEHLAPANSFVVPIVDPVPPAGDTEAFKTDESAPTPRSPYNIIPFSQIRLRRARKTVRLEPPMPAAIEACIARHAALLLPPLPVPSPPLPLPSPLTTSPTDTGAPLGYRAARIRMRALLPSTSRMTNIPKADVLLWKRACLTTPAPRFKFKERYVVGAVRQLGPTLESDLRRYRVEQSGYGITNTWDEIVDTLMEIDLTTLEGVDQRVIELDTTIWQRTEEDRSDHRRIAMLLDREAIYAREAWTGSKYRSAAIAAYVRTLEAQVAALIAQTSSLQTQLTTTLGQRDADRSRNGDNGNDSATGERRQVNFTSCTMQGSVLTWLNSHMRAFGQDVAYAMPWAALNRMITDKYCPSDEIQKLESDVKALKPQLMHEAIKFTIEMMDKKMLTHAELKAEHKRKFDDTSRNNQHQQQPFKRNNVAWAYTARPGDKKPYGGTKPLFPKCNYHHNGPCVLKCTNCKKIGHLARDCKG